MNALHGNTNQQKFVYSVRKYGWQHIVHTHIHTISHSHMLCPVQSIAVTVLMYLTLAHSLGLSMRVNTSFTASTTNTTFHRFYGIFEKTVKMAPIQ